MKRFFSPVVALLFIFVTSSVWADALSGSTLWRLEKKVSDRTLVNYVFGTVHLPDPRVASFPAPLQSSLEQVDTIVLEVILDKTAMSKMGQRMVARPGRGVDALLTEQQMQKLRQALAQRQVSVEAVKHLKPWLIATQLMLPARSPAGASATLEMQLSQYANLHKATLAQLETVDEQLDLFDRLTEADQIDMLMSAANNFDQVEKFTEALMQAYLRGDLEQLQQISDKISVEESNPRLRALMTRLVDDRNRLMLDRMQVFINKGNAMIAVGALHLAGRTGLLNSLEQQGWTLKSVPMVWSLENATSTR